MSDEVFALLAPVAMRVLEDAVFVFSEPLEADDAPDIAVWNNCGVMLEFSGIAQGSIGLWADEGFAQLIAANMLGVDTDDEGASCRATDALKEVLNMIVGNFLTEAYGEEPVFDLGIPHQALAPQPLSSSENIHWAWLDIEGSAILITAELK
jgi:CheY-specific phosphatase CheX